MFHALHSDLAILFWLALAAAPQAPAPDPGELWKVDLDQIASAGGCAPYGRFSNLLFVNNDTLLMAYSCAASKPGAPQTEGMLFDVRNGRAHQPQLYWFAVSYPVLFATAGGNLIYTVTRGIEPSGDLYVDPPDDLDHPGMRRIDLGWENHVTISPDGRTLAMYRERLAPYTPDVVFLDADTLVETGKRFSGFPMTVSNEAIASADLSKGAVSIQNASGNREVYRDPSGCFETRPYFLDDRHLLVIACDHFAVLDQSGKLLYQESYSDKTPETWQEVRYACVARGSRRFALTVSTKESGDPPRIKAQRLIVYEIASGRHAFAIDSIPSIWALSPDGALVAEYGGSVRLFRIP
jgi:hypothetical protein